MPTIDLGSPPPVATASGPLSPLPDRTTLTLPELRLVAELAGDVSLPFDPDGPETPGPGPAGRPDLPDPRASLARRGLLVGDELDEWVLGTMRLLSAPHLAVDLDIGIGEDRARAWHRRRHRSVATLATADGMVFELGRCSVTQWADELARVAVLPRDVTGETRGRLRAVVTDVSGEAPAVVDVVAWLLVADGWRALRPRATGARDRAHLVPVEPADLPLRLAPALAEAAR